MVGDSVRHDVRGAVAAGLDVVLLCSGVHHEALGVPQAPAPPQRPSTDGWRLRQRGAVMEVRLTWLPGSSTARGAAAFA